MNVSNTSDPINRVKCVVNTCKHYKSGDYCIAQSIQVEPRNASNSGETDCATFIPHTTT